MANNNEAKGNAVPQEQLPPGWSEKDLTDKDVAALTELDALEKRFQQGATTIVRGIIELIGLNNGIEQRKNGIVGLLKEKYEIPDGMPWKADAISGKLSYGPAPTGPMGMVPQAPAAPAEPAAPQEAPADGGEQGTDQGNTE